jgi:hypothetical protein
VLALDHDTGCCESSNPELGPALTKAASAFRTAATKITRLVVGFDRERALGDLGLAARPTQQTRGSLLV